MNRNEIIKSIWEDKRQRIPKTKPYWLGINITVGEPNIKHDQFSNNLLELCLEDPAKAYEWSKNWGRTVVTVHPKKGYSLSFSDINSLEEKSCVFLSTSKKIDPKIILNSNRNVGNFSVTVNQDPISYEGALLLYERMTDEVLWCYFLKLKNSFPNIDELKLFKQSIETVYSHGLKFNFANEEEILFQKKLNPNLPIRIYGNILNNGTLPSVIGSVHLPENILSPRCIKRIRFRQSENNISMVSFDRCAKKNKFGTIGVGISLTKKIHLGHVLLIAWAKVIKTSLGIKNDIFIESNDYGPRLFNLVKQLIKPGSTLKETIDDLRNKKIVVDTIDEIYKSEYHEAKNFLEDEISLFHDTNSTMTVISDFTLDSLAKLNYRDISIIPDSSCIGIAEHITDAYNCEWNDYGFNCIRLDHGGEYYFAVLQKNGYYSASLLRAAFIIKLQGFNKSEETSIYLDSSKTIPNARLITQLVGKFDFAQLKGVGIGFNHKIASGKVGDSLDVDKFINYIEFKQNPEIINSFPQILTYFLLTRHEIAPSFRKKPLAPASAQGESFYDYYDIQKFFEDFDRCISEYFVFKRNLLSLLNTLKHGLSRDRNSGGNNNINHKVSRYLKFYDKLYKSEDVNLIIPKPKIANFSNNLRKIRDWYIQFHGLDLLNEFDSVLAEAILNNQNSNTVLSGLLKERRFIGKDLPGKPGDKVDCCFMNDLIIRGYPKEDIVRNTLLYWNGEFILQKRRNAFFQAIEQLCFFVSKNLDNLSKINRDKLYFYMSKFCVFLQFC